ncbi:MAG: hypothetical protein ACYDDO_04685 [Acidiferrobacterales bacterium]
MNWLAVSPVACIDHDFELRQKTLTNPPSGERQAGSLLLTSFASSMNWAGTALTETSNRAPGF